LVFEPLAALVGCTLGSEALMGSAACL